MSTIEKQIDNMIQDLCDTNAAIERSKLGGYAETCGCGALTLQAPCPRCRRERDAKKDNEEGD